MARLRIISGGVVMLIGMVMFAINQLTEFSDQVVLGGLGCIVVGFCVMWYSIPREKRGGF